MTIITTSSPNSVWHANTNQTLVLAPGVQLAGLAASGQGAELVNYGTLLYSFGFPDAAVTFDAGSSGICIMDTKKPRFPGVAPRHAAFQPSSNEYI